MRGSPTLERLGSKDFIQDPQVWLGYTLGLPAAIIEALVGLRGVEAGPKATSFLP